MREFYRAVLILVGITYFAALGFMAGFGIGSLFG